MTLNSAPRTPTHGHLRPSDSRHLRAFGSPHDRVDHRHIANERALGYQGPGDRMVLRSFNSPPSAS